MRSILFLSVLLLIGHKITAQGVSCNTSGLNVPEYIPFAGKWNVGDSKDYIGVWRTGNTFRYGMLDGTGNATVNSVTKSMGSYKDIPLSLDFYGDERDEMVLYNPNNNTFYFYSDIYAGKVEYSKTIGNCGNVPITGNWDGIGKDGFGVYMPDTRQFWFYQDYNSASPFKQIQIDNYGDVPLTGDWDGDGDDEFAMYNSSSRELHFFTNLDSSTPEMSLVVGNSGFTPITGDWDNDGDDEFAFFIKKTDGTYGFWFYNQLTNQATVYKWWQFNQINNISGGKQIFYTDKVPHTDFNGNLLTQYDENLSVFPKGIYNIPDSAIQTAYNAGFNLGFFWPTYYPIDDQDISTLDALNNKFKLIPYLKKLGGKPFTGKFSGSRDLVGICSDEDNLVAYDSDGDNIFDKQLKLGNSGDTRFSGDWNGDGLDDIAIYQSDSIKFFKLNRVGLGGVSAVYNEEVMFMSGDWKGIGRDGYAVYIPSTRQIVFYNDKDSTTPLMTRTVGNSGNIPVAGDWNGDGIDGFAMYMPDLRQFWFFQNYDSSQPFLHVTVGDYYDIPMSGDWNGDGKDGIGIYKTTDQRERHEFWLYDDIYNLNGSSWSVMEDNPMLTLNSPEHVFALHTFDEPTGRKYTLEEVQGFHDAYAQVSPYLLFLVDDHVDNTDERYPKWTETCKIGDAIAHDVYPGHNKESKDITNLSRLATVISDTREITNEDRPNWYVAQAFQELTDKNTFHKPSAQQLEAMIFTSIVHGATGFFDFSYHNGIFNTLTGMSSYSYTDLWNKAKVINSQIDYLAPYILSNTPSAGEHGYQIFAKETPQYDAAPIRTLLKRNPAGNDIIIAVNITSQPLNAVISLPNNLAPGDRLITKDFSVQQNTLAGGINDYFAPFDVHVYELSASTGSVGLRAGYSDDESRLIEKIGVDHMRVYPNPSASGFYFENVDGAIEKITIRNIKGELIKIIDLSMSDSSDLYYWNAVNHDGVRVNHGMYFYQIIKNNGGIQTGKLIVK